MFRAMAVVLGVVGRFLAGAALALVFVAPVLSAQGQIEAARRMAVLLGC